MNNPNLPQDDEISFFAVSFLLGENRTNKNRTTKRNKAIFQEPKKNKRDAESGKTQLNPGNVTVTIQKAKNKATRIIEIAVFFFVTASELVSFFTDENLPAEYFLERFNLTFFFITSPNHFNENNPIYEILTRLYITELAG